MKTTELIKYSRKKIKGRRAELFIICTPPVFAEMFFRIAEAGLYSILIYLGAFTPSELFTGKNTKQIIISVIFNFLRFIISAPLYCASAVRLIEFIDDRKEKTFFSDMLSDGRFLWRSISAFFMKKLISAVFLAPSVVSGAYAVYILSSDADNRELFILSGVIVFCVCSFFTWISVKLNMLSVPFLLAQYPEKSGAGVVVKSFGFMKGRKKIFFGMALVYFIPVVTLVALPFVVPDIVSAYVSCISIFFKEDEYARSIKPVYVKKRLFAKRQRGEI